MAQNRIEQLKQELEALKIELADTNSCLERRESLIKSQNEKLVLYREMVGRMALAENKNESWQLMRSFWDGHRIIGHDLNTPQEQKAFLFG